MLRKKSAARGGAERASSIVESLRPIVTRALRDPEVQLALRHAFETGRILLDELGGKDSRAAARTLAEDRKLRRRVRSSALELRDAFEHASEPPARRGGRRLLTLLLAAGAAAGAFYFARNRGGDAGDGAGS